MCKCNHELESLHPLVFDRNTGEKICKILSGRNTGGKPTKIKFN